MRAQLRLRLARSAAITPLMGNVPQWACLLIVAVFISYFHTFNRDLTIENPCSYSDVLRFKFHEIKCFNLVRAS